MSIQQRLAEQSRQAYESNSCPASEQAVDNYAHLELQRLYLSEGATDFLIIDGDAPRVSGDIVTASYFVDHVSSINPGKGEAKATKSEYKLTGKVVGNMYTDIIIEKKNGWFTTKTYKISDPNRLARIFNSGEPLRPHVPSADLKPFSRGDRS